MRDINSYLTHAHQRLEQRLEAIEHAIQAEEWPDIDSEVGALASALSAQIAREEKLLFPCFEGRGRPLASLISGLRAEHAMMRMLLRQLSAAAAIRDGRSLRGAAHELASIVRSHDETEERLIVPSADRQCTAQVERMIAEMETGADAVRGVVS